MPNDYLTPEEALESAGSSTWDWLKRQLDLSKLRQRLPGDDPAWRGGTPASDMGGIAEGMGPMGPVTEPPTTPDFTPHVSDILNLPQVHQDFTAAAAGDPTAKARIAALRNSPAVSDLGTPKPSPLSTRRPILGAPETDSAPSLMSLPAAHQEGPQGLMPLHPPTGGGGVEVQDQQKKHDWRTGLAGLTVGLGDIFSALGNPRAGMGKGAGYEMAKDYLQTQQVQALQRRQRMFDDAYQQAKALPAEIYTDERFAGLRGAAQNILTVGDKGEVDNEKAVSSFLTEMSRHKDELDQIQQISKAKDEMQVRDLIAQHEAGLTDLYGPSAGQKWQNTLDQQAEQKRQFGETQARMREQTHEQSLARMEVAKINAEARKEQAEAQRTGRAATGLSSMLSNTMKMYEQRDADGNVMNPDDAYKKTIQTHADDIIAAGEQVGLRIQKAGTRDVPLLVINGRPMNAVQGLQYIRSMVAYGGGQ